MRRGLEDVRHGFDVDCDAVVVGSGPGGAVAALNLAQAGMRVAVVEAGPEVRSEDMTRDAPRFLARHFWDGGLRLIGGTVTSPSLQARCLGGGSVVNSAIMMVLPDWVRSEWRREAGVDTFDGPELDAAFARVLRRCQVAPTPMAVMGRRNLVVRDALERGLGVQGEPLPRAVAGCEGCSDCLTGCASGRKLSVDRSWLPDAERCGAEIFTCAEVDRILTEGDRAVGVTGHTVDPHGQVRLAPFRVRARVVVLAAGTMHTPVLLQRSRINPGGRVGATMFCHLTSGLVGFMDEPVDPWVGATQGWGAISSEVPGLKYEGLWASPSVLLTRWGDVGARFLEQLRDVRYAACVALVYRGRVSGTVRATRRGTPRMRLWIPEDNVPPVMRGMKAAVDGLLRAGARYVYAGVANVDPELRTPRDTEVLLSPKIRARHLVMTLNHTFGSCRMTADPSGPVDPDGRVRGVQNLYVCDASVFPSPSAVNPQATIMALADITSRRLGGLDLMAGPPA